jgi:hypothetical protein
VKTGLENLLLSPHNALTKAFTTNLSFPPVLRVRSVKTVQLYSE